MSGVEEATTTPEPAEPPSVVTETAAMRRVAGVLEALEGGARRRVLAWLADRYGLGGEAT